MQANRYVLPTVLHDCMHWTQHINHMGSILCSCLQILTPFLNLRTMADNRVCCTCCRLDSTTVSCMLARKLGLSLLWPSSRSYTTPLLLIISWVQDAPMTICSHTCTRMFQQQPKTETYSPAMYLHIHLSCSPERCCSGGGHLEPHRHCRACIN